MSCVQMNQKFFEGVVKTLACNVTIQRFIVSYSPDLDKFISEYPNKALLRMLSVINKDGTNESGFRII